MAVLQHEHRLTLVDLNPKYPIDEVVYDDEEHLIIKQALQCPCDRCDQKITYVHRFYYKCDECDYSLHKLCAELPSTLNHASHTAHTLTLFLDESSSRCHMCNSIPQYKQLRYHCSDCMFNMCLDCAMNEIQYHTIYHPSHQHPLIPTTKQMSIECDACGHEHYGVFYQCITCFRSFIHNECIFLPKRLLIQDSTSDLFFHTHPLILTYSFPKVVQQTNFKPLCRICDDSFSKNQNIWIYKCDKCRYYVHLDCAYLKGKRCESVVNRKTLYKDNDDPAVPHLPLFERSYTIVKDASIGTYATTLTYSHHEHPLIRVHARHITRTFNDDDDICDVCIGPIMKNMMFYKCTSQGCDFVMHDYCTRLPTELKDYKGHPEHPLRLIQKVRDDQVRFYFFCDICETATNGLAYSCVKCEYNIDVPCALIPTKISHKSHPYHLLRRTHHLHTLSGLRQVAFTCRTCNYHIHVECALLLPETFRHRYDKHPMTLSYSPIENHVGDYFCEICEEELNPNIFFYHCRDCVQSMHSACVLQMLDVDHSKSFITGLCRNANKIKYH